MTISNFLTMSAFLIFSNAQQEKPFRTCDLMLSEINNKYQDPKYWDEEVSIYDEFYVHVLKKWSSADNAFLFFKNSDLKKEEIKDDFLMYGPSLLYSALLSRNTEQIKFYLKSGIDPIKHYRGFGKILITAANLGEPEIFELFRSFLSKRKDAQHALEDLDGYHTCLNIKEI